MSRLWQGTTEAREIERSTTEWRWQFVARDGRYRAIHDGTLLGHVWRTEAGWVAQPAGHTTNPTGYSSRLGAAESLTASHEVDVEHREAVIREAISAHATRAWPAALSVERIIVNRLREAGYLR